ncbi:MAG: hypothetical protein GXW85_06140 [Clostridia bacterium]|nr:hypothetical protein [Clostridia bacterium]
MSWKKYKYIYMGLLTVFFLSGGLSYYWIENSRPQKKPQVPHVQEPLAEVFKISSETQIFFTEKYVICQRYGLKCPEIKTEFTSEQREQLNGLTFEELEEKLAQENKTFEKNNDIVTIITWKEGLCSEHKKIWHLGSNNTNEYVTVYYGPSKVKSEGGIYKVTEIPISQLPSEYQEKIRNHSMEFIEEEELIATLDSFSD